MRIRHKQRHEEQWDVIDPSGGWFIQAVPSSGGPSLAFAKADYEPVPTEPAPCPQCGKTYAPQEGGVLLSCCVRYAPGVCCHYGQREIKTNTETWEDVTGACEVQEENPVHMSPYRWIGHRASPFAILDVLGNPEYRLVKEELFRQDSRGQHKTALIAVDAFRVERKR